MANVNRTGASGGGQSPKKNGVRKHKMPSGRYYKVDAIKDIMLQIIQSLMPLISCKKRA